MPHSYYIWQLRIAEELSNGTDYERESTNIVMEIRRKNEDKKDNKDGTKESEEQANSHKEQDKKKILNNNLFYEGIVFLIFCSIMFILMKKRSYKCISLSYIHCEIIIIIIIIIIVVVVVVVVGDAVAQSV
jgi:hypothetical protein